jgi:hypothetical protein
VTLGDAGLLHVSCGWTLLRPREHVWRIRGLQGCSTPEWAQ